MSIAYSSKNSKFHIDSLKETLLYSYADDVTADCQHYSLKMNDDKASVFFSKECFNGSVAAVSIGYTLFLLYF